MLKNVNARYSTAAGRSIAFRAPSSGAAWQTERGGSIPNSIFHGWLIRSSPVARLPSAGIIIVRDAIFNITLGALLFYFLCEILLFLEGTVSL